jgi:glycosyltransferase involved in cell wall biosynthesis
MITVLMPVYKGATYLNEAIESILNQSYTNFEFLIINDGSPDNSEEIILSYTDNRIRYIKNEQNMGLIATLNKGIKLAKGEYIARMDQDDISLPDRFHKQIEFMEQHPEVGICGSYVEEFGIDPAIVKFPETHDEIVASLLFYSPISHPASIWRTNIFSTYSLQFNKDFVQAEDYKLWTDASTYVRLYNFPQVLLNYRRHPLQDGYKSLETNIKSTKRVKLEFLERLIKFENAGELDEVQNILSGKPAYNTNTIKVISKICQANKQKAVFNQKILERKFANSWKNAFLKKKKISLREMYFLYSQNITKIATLTLKQHIYILSKLRLNA